MEKKLAVNNLVISFRTPGGKVQAVRDISFDLYKGETLAIVGESGSGKSVTSKAILGILAGNSIVESGSIIYDGMDLLRVTEDDFYHIRGDKISMIFQDPLSSLNPIMRIGRQLTEAMLLKGKARQKASKKAFNDTLALLKDAMIKANAEGDSALAAEITQMCKDFDKFEFKHTELERDFNRAHESAVEAHDDIKEIQFYIEKNALKDEKYTLKELVRLLKETYNDWVVTGKDAENLKTLVNELTSASSKAISSKDFNEVNTILGKVDRILETALEKTRPDFFSLAYFETFSKDSLPEVPVEELNKRLGTYLEDNFMHKFRLYVEKALVYSNKEHNEKKREVLTQLAEKRSVFEGEKLSRKTAYATAKKLISDMEASIDKLEIHKDSTAYTFDSNIMALLNEYFEGEPKNKEAAKKHAKQQAKYDKLVARGKAPTWKVTPSMAVNLKLIQQNILDTIDRNIAHYNEVLSNKESRNFAEETTALIDFFKENASGVVLKVTKTMAKHKAIKLMNEVGIPDARRRFKQYPFEFSGGMRQRIVIAIALAADPDILICDEPTTALDVTIQAQILELINKLKEERKLSIIFITHDLGVVANMADRIAVMYAGKIVEYGTSNDVFYSPAHPYTWALLSAMPDVETNERLVSIPGTPPNMIYPPVGDAFAERNAYALKIDFEQQPPMFKISDTHSAATWLLHPDAPKVEMPKIVTERIERMRNKGGAIDAE